MEYEEYCRSMGSPAKINAYLRELENLETRSYRTTICPFTKIEKMNFDSYKPPRMIQSRHMSFNIMYGRYIKPLETVITKTGRFNYNFGKGTYDQIAQKVAKLKKKYNYFTEIDHDAFDSRVTQQMLSLTHKFYQSCFYHNKELNKLSKATLNNRCKDRHGQTYDVVGTRMSGDVDTSFGNCLINYAILKQVLAELNIEGDCIVNGDDSIIFTNQPIDIVKAQQILAKYNMESKIKPSSSNIHQVEFCRTKFVYRSDGTPTMMFDQERLYRFFGMTFRCLDNYSRYIDEIIYCHMMININIPTHYAWKELVKEGFEPSGLRRIDLNVRRLLERESKNQLSTPEYTISMFEAYPNILRTHHKINTITRRIRKSINLVVINHDLKQIAVSYT